MKPKEHLQIPEVLSSETVFQQFIGVRKDRLRNARGEDYSYYSLIVPSHAVAVLAFTADGKLVLNREYRHPTSKILLGPPAGYIDAEEKPEVAAARELMEETGYEAEGFQIIGRTFPYPGISGQEVIFVKARNARKVAEPAHETAETLYTVELSIDELREIIQRGETIDGQLCAALTLLQMSH